MVADGSEGGQHGGTDFQPDLPAVANDLARRLKQAPAHGLHLRAFPAASERIGAKAAIEIVGQHADGKEYG